MYNCNYSFTFRIKNLLENVKRTLLAIIYVFFTRNGLIDGRNRFAVSSQFPDYGSGGIDSVKFVFLAESVKNSVNRFVFLGVMNMKNL